MDERELIKSCLDGNKKSLELLIESIQDLIYNLSIRFVWNKMDAQDATQEILIKVLTNLSKYDGRSKFTTWVYRLATNYLINLKKSTLEKTFTTFDVFATDLKSNIEPKSYELPDKDLMEREMKTGCTLAMLQCLNRELRIAFILGSILKLKSKEAANIVNISPENFRKRLQKSRSLIGNFLSNNCGVYNPNTSCRCSHKINCAISSGRIVRNSPNFTKTVEGYNNEMEELTSMEGIYRNHGTFRSGSKFLVELKGILDRKGIINDTSFLN